ncbi:RIP homotypic interaction motif-containing protein [Paractinoplanes maris]|uniref:RIP homotypic interaction motif-containing protein n=1 Tax=Paractinoplanes maris TaxID=1734446 RepID=UPI00201FBAE0|nr:RIP homotypic interaction motif-containing protein [Actinoplanes maris]
MITTALAAAARAGAKDNGPMAVRHAYTDLKDLLRDRLGAHDLELARLLEADETDPGVWRARLSDALVLTRTIEDEQVVAAARRLLATVGPTGPAAGKYRVDLRDAKGVQIGDHNVQHNTF